MLLRNSLIFLFLINLFLKSWQSLAVIGLLFFSVNLWKNSDLMSYIKKLKFVMFFYASTCMVQILYIQEGKVLWSLLGVHITDLGLETAIVNLLRVTNIIMASWIFNSQRYFRNFFLEYQKIVEIVISLVPEVLIYFKSNRNFKGFFRYILKKVYRVL